MTTPSTSSFEPGDVLLGKYSVERVLGKGGMGMVLAVRHLHLGELYAMKIMLPEMLDHPEAVGRFLREARASARLRGEHVARVHDVGTLENGVPYMVLELLQGADLDHWLTTRGKLGVGEACSYVYQVCEALVEAHGLGIIHRDLKPANLFLTRKADGTPCIKVLDFGISKDVTNAESITSKLTKTGAIMGSPHYMSPEQLIDSKTVDGRSDIWALGVILYEISTGTMPFQAETMPEIVAKVLSVTPPPPSQIRPGLPTNFDSLVQRCMDKNRDNRYQSVQEVMQALTSFINPSDLPRASFSSIAPPSFSGTNESVTQSAVSLGQETISASAPTIVQAPPTASRRIVGITAIAGILLGIGIVAFVMTRAEHSTTEEAANVMRSAATSEKSASPEVPVATVPSADVVAPVPSATQGTKQNVPVSTTKIPPPVVSTTTKTKSKVKGFDE